MTKQYTITISDSDGHKMTCTVDADIRDIIKEKQGVDAITESFIAIKEAFFNELEKL
jgi:hypothetical protein